MIAFGEPDEQRSREQQQHDRAVHREQLVVDLFVDDLQTGRASSALISRGVTPPMRKNPNDLTM
jgi:hypothetical protein